MTTQTTPTTSSPRWNAAWQGTFAAVMGIALTGLVALAFGSIAGPGPADTTQACHTQPAGTLERC
jgi:hypothetical protein